MRSHGKKGTTARITVIPGDDDNISPSTSLDGLITSVIISRCYLLSVLTKRRYQRHITGCSQRLFAGSEPLPEQSGTPSTVRRIESRDGMLSGCWVRCSVGCRFRLFPHGRSAYLASAL